MTLKTDNYKLWQKCFHDEKAFLDLYFSNCYTDQNTMSIYQNHQLVAALQMLDYSMTYGGNKISTSYISGACTHPDFRNKGYMKNLLEKTHQQMLKNKITLSTLIPAEPWLWKFYEKAGYAPVFYAHYAQLSLSQLTQNKNNSIQIYNTFSEKKIFDFFSRKMAEREYCIQHTWENFQTIVKDLQLSQGQIWTAVQKNKICGILFAYPTEKILQVTELLTDTTDTQNSLLIAAGEYYHLPSIHIKTVAYSDDRTKTGMARVIQPQKMLTYYAQLHPNETHFLQLQGDTSITQNNGYYTIQNGGCTFRTQPDTTNFYQLLSVSELTHFLFCNTNAYMGLMLD